MTNQDPKYKHKPSEKHTLEEVLKSLQDLIRNDLLDQDRSATSAEKSATLPEAVQEKAVHEPAESLREDFAPADAASGPVNFDAVMRSLKDLVSNELNVGDEPVPAVEPSVTPADAGASLEDIADELGPLDEELTFEESIDIVPPPPVAPPMQELPGEISAEMLAEPENPPPAPEPVSQKPSAPGVQQELAFDVELPTIEARSFAREPVTEKIPDAPPPVAETESSAQSPAQEIPEEPAAIETAPEITDQIAEEKQQAPPEEALPTIEVEETFDENAYFGSAETVQQGPSSESDAILLIEPDVPAPETSETSPEISNEPLTMEDLTLAPEPVPEKTELKLEVVDEPAAEQLLGMPSVDFETVEFNPPGDEPSPSPQNPETPKPAEESPSVAEATSSSPPETKSEAAPVPEPPAAGEAVAEPTPGAEKIAKEAAASPPVAASHEPMPSEEPVAPKPPESLGLDDIPVLQEVVAPPAGSVLTKEPLPAPDRARDIVVRAVAKLNVEMRKTGGAGLDTKTILRLQQLIRQELEQTAEKVKK